MTSIPVSTELLRHPDFELIIEILEGLEEIEEDLELSLFWFLVLLLLGDDDAFEDFPPDEDGDDVTEVNLGDDEDAKRRKAWAKWRKKVKKEFARQLRKKGFKGNVIKQIIKDYMKAILPKPSMAKMLKFIAKWLWALKKVLDAYKAAKKKVGPPPDNDKPPPPEDVSTDGKPLNLYDLLYEEQDVIV